MAWSLDVCDMNIYCFVPRIYCRPLAQLYATRRCISNVQKGVNRRIVDQYVDDKTEDLKNLAEKLKEDYAKEASRVRTVPSIYK